MRDDRFARFDGQVQPARLHVAELQAEVGAGILTNALHVPLVSQLPGGLGSALVELELQHHRGDVSVVRVNQHRRVGAALPLGALDPLAGKPPTTPHGTAAAWS